MSNEKSRTGDPASDVLHYEWQSLDFFFSPRSIAVIGATDKAGSVGRTILWNLIRNPFGGTVYPVNPKHSSILGIRAYPTLAAIGEPVDVAVIVTPAESVPGIMAECANAGAKGAIIISAGFKETGAHGAELEQQILEQARRAHIRVIGPNCLGIMRPMSGLNATFASSIARPGSVAFISQSGALCAAVLDWSFRENVGFSVFASIGSMLDVGWGHLIDYLGDDPRTQSIVIYMESIGDARSFISAAREVALTKPIIIIKAGRTEAAARAASSHTGALVGSDDVLEAVFRRSGVLRVESVSDLFYMAEVLAKQPRPRGPRLLVVTNAGGPGVLAADALVASGGELTELSAESISAFNQLLPAHWSHNNPVDILGDADPKRYAKAVEIASQDANADGLLVILTPQAMTDPTKTAEELKPFARLHAKPILASWMGGSEVEPGERLLNQNQVPTFGYPDTAAHMFTYMWRYTYNLRGIYETPVLAAMPDGREPDRERVQETVNRARAAGRTLLSEAESKSLLQAYGLPVVEARVASSEDEAVTYAEALGYPVVLKLHSYTITHKTEAGGVRLDLPDAASVREAYRAIATGAAHAGGRPAEASTGESAADSSGFLGVTVQPMVKSIDAYELILGSSIDPQFGPVLLFGSGGTLVEVFKDRALALPPLTTTLARRLMEQTRIYTALQGVRGRAAVDLAALEQLLVQFSQLVVEQRWIKEIDINPLLASPSQLIALDARIVLHDPALTADQLPHLSIRPYPIQYIWPFELKDGTPVTIRPIRPEDEPLIVKFHETLSEASVYMRYFHVMQLSQRIAHERLTRICFIDYDREMALVADHRDPQTGERQILAVGRLSRVHGSNDAEFAILISDPWQGHGLGTELLTRLVEIGRAEGRTRILADILSDNIAMQNVARKLHFKLKRVIGDTTIKASLEF